MALAIVALVGAFFTQPVSEAESYAQQFGLPADHLQAAADTVGVDVRQYLVHEGLLQPPAAPSNPRVECIIRHESGGDPSAVNRRSGASGLGQFLPSTWRTTPQGKAGLSVFDPAANRAAVAWMLQVGRAREFEVVTRRLC